MSARHQDYRKAKVLFVYYVVILFGIVEPAPQKRQTLFFFFF